MYDSLEEEGYLEVGEYTDYLGYDPVHAKNNPMYNHQRYKSLKEFSEVTSDENYQKWHESYEKGILQAAGEKRGLQKSKELLKNLNGKVKPEHRMYLEHKLRTSDSPYANLILKSLQKGKLDEDAYTKTLKRYADLDYGEEPVLDTNTTPSRELLERPGTFKPANDDDVQFYYKYRPNMTFREYMLIREQENEENEWREKWDVNSKIEYEIYNESLEDIVARLEQKKEQADPQAGLEGKGASKATVFVSDLEGSDQESHLLRETGLDTLMNDGQLDADFMKMDQEKQTYLLQNLLNYELTFSRYGLEIPDQEDQDRSYQESRQAMRESFGSIGKEPGFHFDAPTLDLQRDLKYEQLQRFKRTKQFDLDAFEHTVDYNFENTHLGEENYKKIQMAPKADSDDSEEISEYHTEKLREEYQDIRNWRKENIALRVKIAKDIANLRNKYNEMISSRQQLVKMQKNKVDAKEQQAATRGLYDFVEEQQISDQTLQMRAKSETFNSLQQTMQKHKFDPESSSLSMYELELHYLSRLAASTGTNYSRLFEFVFDCMKKHGVQQSSNIKARMFEYAVMVQQKDIASKLLQQLLDQPTTQPISTHYLEKFFAQCAKSDNLDGIAHLTNYCERNQVNIGSWDLSLLRTGLNYYLNTKFDLSKVLIFTKFYAAYYNARSNLVSNNRQSSQKTHAAIFGQYEDLVDMKALFGFLVDHLGSQSMVDPVTKQDILMSLVNTFTRNPHVYAASQLSSTSTIDCEHIAKYLASQFTRHDSLEQILTVARRLDHTSAGVAFTDSLLRHLRDFQTQNNQLPYRKESLRKMYLTLRATNQLQFNKASTELLLFMLKQAGLLEEVIDYCSQSKNQSQVSQYYLSEALLAMKLKKSASYTKLLSQADLMQTDKPSALQLTQATKAVFLDQGGAAGIAYFNSHKKALLQERTARENMFVSIYDSVFKAPEATTFQEFKQSYKRSSIVAARLVKESFAVSQLSAIIERKNYDEIEKMFSYYTLLKEERALSQKLHGFHDKKTKKELQNVKDRRQMVGNQLAATDIEALQSIATAMQDDKIELLTKKQGVHLQQYLSLFKQMTVDDVSEIQDRQDLLEMKRRYKYQFIDATDSEPDEDVLLVLDSIVNEKKYGLELRPDSDEENRVFDEVKDQFKEGIEGQEQSESDIDQWGIIKDKKAYLRKLNKSSEDELEIVLTPEQKAEVQRKVAKHTEELNEMQKAFEANIKDWTPEYEDDQQKVEDSEEELEIEYKRIGEPILKRSLRNHEEIDAVFQEFQAHFFGQVESQQEQRQMGVPTAEQQQEMQEDSMFKKHMAIRYKERKGQEVQAMTHQEKDKYDKWLDNQLNGTLSVDDESFNDPELLVAEAYNSTLFEMKEDLIKALSRRRQHVLPIALEIFNKLQEKSYRSQSLEYQRFQHESQVTAIDENIEKLRYLVIDHRSPLLSTLAETEHYSNLQGMGEFKLYYNKNEDFYNPLDHDHFKRDNERLKQLDKEVADISSSIKVINSKLVQQKEEVLRTDVFDTKRDPHFDSKHDEMIQDLYEAFKKSNQQTDRAHKIQFMKNALALQLGENNIETAYPQFYALDLVHFGVERRIPEAIRLGEQLLAEQGAKMPQETARIVRQYLLNSSNNQKYREGIKFAGPTSSRIYHQTQNTAEPIFCLDDPYWRDFLLQNSKREDQWRTPSMLAWQHKPYGIIGEVIDVEKMRSKFQSMV